ncbi:hypothetical protein IID23_03055 [Patescibacteria group bacterium]|nr:hypothetical protein [Patescibacteria group bacterium]
MGKKSREKKLESEQSKKTLNPKLITYIFVPVLIVGIIGTLVASSYLNWKILPFGVSRIVDITIASVPFIPKTPTQILSKAYFETGRIKSGEHSFSLNVNQSSETLTEQVLFLNISGPFRKFDDQIDFSGRASLKLSSNEHASEINFVEENDYIYFQMNNPPSFPNLELSGLGDNWYQLDVTKILNDSKADVRGDKEIEKTIREKTDILLRSIVSNELFERIAVLPDEFIDGSGSYHFRLSFNKEETNEIVKKFIGESEGSLLNKVSIDVWVDKSRMYFNKIAIEGTIAGQPLSSASVVTLKTTDLNFTLVYQLTKPNEDVAITTPESSNELSSLLDLYLLVQPQGDQNAAAAILGVATNLNEFGANFLTVERLLHVLYLAPQSF